MTTITLTTRIVGLDRMPNSVNANPAWRVHTDDGTWLTAPDASCAYGIDNPEVRDSLVHLTITDNRITHANPTECRPCIYRGSACENHMSEDQRARRDRNVRAMGGTVERARHNERAASRRISMRARLT